MIVVTITIEVDSEDSPATVAENIKSNLRDALGHAPFSAEIVSCEGTQE